MFSIRRNHPYRGVITLCTVKNGGFAAQVTVVAESQFIAEVLRTYSFVDAAPIPSRGQTKPAPAPVAEPIYKEETPPAKRFPIKKQAATT